MRNFARLNNAANRLQAWEDWRNIAAYARLLGIDDETIAAIAPKKGDGWRKVDRCIAALRAKLEG